MADKETKLSIVIRTVDKATAKIKEINDRLDNVTKPFKDFKEALADLREKSGLDNVIEKVGGVGSAFMGAIGKIAVVGGVLAAATAGVLALVDGFDDLGDKAEKLGVSVDFIAQLRYAAERSGASVEELDAGLQSFTTSLGQARAGTGKMTGFLKIVSPALLKQLKAAKSNEEAFGLLANAMVKIQDPAKRAAFAAKTVGNAALGPLLARGAKGVDELRQRYLQLAGSQEGAVAAAGPVDDALKDMKASTDGLKASIVSGLAPAISVIVQRLTEWFVANRPQIEEWARAIGERLPGAVLEIAESIRSAGAAMVSIVDKMGGIKAVAVAAAAVIAGPFVLAVVNLGIALGTVLAKLLAIRSAAAAAAAAAAAGAGAPAAAGAAAAGSAGAATAAAGAAGAAARGGGLAAAAKVASRLVLPVTLGFVASDLTGGPTLGRKMREMSESFRNRKEVPTDQLQQLAAPAPAQAAQVTVDFKNAPAGTRVTADPQSTANVDLSVGYQGVAL